MQKWELAKYLIEAKKNVDSVWYIAENVPVIANINLREKEESILRSFYVNCCNVLDKSFPKKKKALCAEDEIIARIYYERDKKYAHKDENYKAIPFNSLSELCERMKQQLIHVRKVCADFLPKEVTLDFVPHDKELFRFINGLTADKEEEIKRRKYIGYDQPIPPGSVTYERKPLYDTDAIRDMTDEQKKEYCVIIENGLNSYEGVQERQDSCIKINLLDNQNIWATPNQKSFACIKKLKDAGLIDQYEIPVMEKLSDEKNFGLFKQILSEK